MTKLTSNDYENIISSLNNIIKEYDRLSIAASSTKMQNYWKKENIQYQKTLKKIIDIKKNSNNC